MLINLGAVPFGVYAIVQVNLSVTQAMPKLTGRRILVLLSNFNRSSSAA